MLGVPRKMNWCGLRMRAAYRRISQDRHVLERSCGQFCGVLLEEEPTGG